MNTTLSSEIYKLDSKGNLRTWQYEVQGGSWRTIAGLKDGKKVTSEWTACVPASQPTAELQALFEAQAEATKKLKRDYHLTIAGTEEANYFKPMLAKEYDAELVQRGDLAQRKFDGIRCVAKKAGLFSRNGEPLTACPHISEQLAPVFAKYPDLVLDGELYNHDFHDDFNELSSIIRKKTPDAEQVARAARDIEYHVYDLVSGGDLAANALSRNKLLTLRLLDAGPSIIPVETFVVNDHEEVRALFRSFVDEGYEGLMVRRASAGYHQGRTKDLMKFKEFKTAEFPVVRVEQGIGNWAGYGKRVVCQLPDGREFGAGVKGDRPFCKKLLERDVKIATIRFFDYTPDGVPRFPVAIDFDRPDA